MKKLSYILLCGLMLILSACEKDIESSNFAPVVTTGTASNIYRMGATLSGSITLTETNTAKEYGILFSELESMAEYDEYPVKDGSTSYSVLIQNLEPGETYYYCAYASSGYSIAKSQIKSFTTTQSNAPVFNEVVLQSKDEKSCAVSTELLDDGGSELLMTGFVWAEAGSGEPTIKSNVVNVELQGSRMSATIKGMEPNKTYLVRAYGVNAQGVGYSNSISVTTNTATVPVLSDIIAPDSTEVSVTVRSSIVDAGLGEVTKVGFCYSSESKNPTTDHLVVEEIHGSPESEYFAAIIEGLKPETTYYIRAYAINEKGTGYSETFVYTTKAPTEPGIYSLDDLIAFRDAVSGGHYSDANLSQWVVDSNVINLYADIDLTSIDNWTNINMLDYGYVFDGNGHTIYLKETTLAEEGCAVFYGNMGTIQNLNVTMDITLPSSGDGITKAYATVCIVNYGAVQNCHSKVAADLNYRGACFGGIVYGNNTGATISDCTSEGVINGGLILGGIAAQNAGGTINDCISNITFVDGDPDTMGGITGYNYYSGKVLNCTNNGNFSSVSSASPYGVGGIVGRLFNGTVDNCRNNGNFEIPLAAAVGGIAGNASEIIDIEPNNVTRIVRNCTNNGAIVGPDGVTGNMIGVLDGEDSEMVGCTYGGTVNGAAGTEANAIGKDLRVVTPTEPGIYTLDDLLAFRDAVNNGADISQWVDESNVINLYADIDATSEKNWTPITKLVEDYVFDGNNHAIILHKTDIYYENWEDWGFFVNNYGSIQNLQINLHMPLNLTWNSNTKRSVNYATFSVYNYGNIVNCHAVLDTFIDEYGIEFGGIVNGNLSNGVISQCSAYSMSEISSRAFIGGIAHQNEGGIIKECVNYLNICFTASAGEALGGIVTYNRNNGKIDNCINHGTIRSTTNAHFNGIGGIVACMLSGIVDNSINNGSIYDFSNVEAVGGIVGNASIDDPDYTTYIARVVSNCTNTGDINGPDGVTGNIIGVLAGEASEMKGCTYGGTVNGVAGTEANAIGKDLR